ncbi:MAG: pyridoxamine 5'-phosphate oxidase family protein [Negativicutes bacterium]
MVIISNRDTNFYSHNNYKGGEILSVIWLDEDEAMQYLATRFDGRLSTVSTSGEPYITPLHYVLCNGNLYFHCSTKGKKLQNIRTNNSVCFEVSETEQSILIHHLVTVLHDILPRLPLAQLD